MYLYQQFLSKQILFISDKNMQNHNSIFIPIKTRTLTVDILMQKIRCFLKTNKTKKQDAFVKHHKIPGGQRIKQYAPINQFRELAKALCPLNSILEISQSNLPLKFNSGGSAKTICLFKSTQEIDQNNTIPIIQCMERKFFLQ